MSDRRIELAVKRGRLLERSATLRLRLQQESHGIETLCAAGDRVAAGVRQVRAHPEWAFAAVLALVVMKPRRLWRWSKTGLLVWRGYAALRGHWPGLSGKARHERG